MNAIYKVLLSVLVFLVIGSSIGTVYYYNKIKKVYDEDSMRNAYDSKYHFSLILKSDDFVYWQDFKEGVYEAANAMSCAVEYNSIDTVLADDKIIDYINIAINSKVDGIIVNGDSSEDYHQAIEMVSRSTGVVLGGVEGVKSARLSYVGTNFYEYGISAARLISKIPSKKSTIKIGVILPSPKNETQLTSVISQNDLMMSGLISVIENDNKLFLASVKYKQSELLGAEDLIRNILTEYSDIDVIFCSNARDTMAATNVIIERNLVGKVYIIGTDMTDSIANYIKKGIIFGVLDRNGYEAGYNSIVSLLNYNESNFQTSYEDIDIDVYTKTNITSYRKR